jgi:hypothetical protein
MACNSDEIGSTPFDFVDPEIYLCSRECMGPLLLFQMANNFVPRMPSSVKNLITSRDPISIFLTRFAQWEDFCPRNFPANDFRGASFSHYKMTDVVVILMQLLH